jgi:DUF917 family protein
MPTSRSRHWELASEDVAALACGARLKGSGGGGEPRSFALMAKQMLTDGGPMPVAHPSELPQDGLVIAAAMIGSPAILGELLPEGTEFVRAVTGLARYVDAEPVAVMGLEAAGVNVFPPILMASALGLPVVDVDGMGRAFARLDQTMFHVRGRDAGPMVVTAASGELVVIDAGNAVTAERLARGTLAALGGWAGTACFPMTVAEARQAGLYGGLAQTLALGRAVQGARDGSELAARAGARRLGEGRVLAVERADVHGPRGWALVEPADETTATLRIEFQTEYLVAALDGEVVATTPDLIVVAALHGLAPIACEDLRRGDEVAVLALDVDPAWKDPGALELVDAAAFGYPAAHTT